MITSFFKGKSRLWVFLWVLGGLLIAWWVFAWIEGGGLNVDFNAYTIASLNGQDGWSAIECTFKDFQVESTTTWEGAKAISYTSTSGNGDCQETKLVASSTQNGTQYFYLKVDDPAFSQNAVNFKDELGNTITSCGIYSVGTGKFSCLAQGYTRVDTGGTPLADTWYEMKVEWRSSDHKFKFTVIYPYGGSVEFTPYKTNWNLVNSIEVYGFNWKATPKSSYFDTLSSEEAPPPYIYGYDPTFSILNPACDSFTTTTSPIEFTANGNVLIPNQNPTLWNTLWVSAINYNTGVSTGFATSFDNGCTAGHTCYFSVPFGTASTTLSDGAYYLSFTLQGLNLENYTVQTANLKCGEGNGIGTEAPSSVLLPEIPYCPTVEQEDCTGYGLADRLACNIKNVLISAFYPSCQDIRYLQTVVEGFEGKAPFNYIQGFASTIEDVSDLQNTSTPVTIGLFGATNTISFDFLGATLASTIRNWIKLLLILILIFYFFRVLRSISRLQV